MTSMTPITQARWDRYQLEGDLQARAQLLDQYLGLVRHIALKILRGLAGDVELDDLIGAGTLGLVIALESFDSERGLAFSTFATPRIRGAILDELRSRDWVPRSVRSRRRKVQTAVHQLEGHLGETPDSPVVAATLGIDLDTYWRWQHAIDGAGLISFDAAVFPEDGESTSLEELVADPAAIEPTEDLARQDEIAGMKEAITELPAKERTVLALYYYEELTLKGIAEILHLTESRICQIRAQAIRRLRSKLGARVAA